MLDKRSGPGRPRISDAEKTQPYTVSLTPTEAEAIRKFGNGNLTEGIRKAIADHHWMAQRIAQLEGEPNEVGY